MLGVIVGNESVGIGIDFIQEWNQCLLEDLKVEWGIHDAFKYTDACTPSHADPCPDVHFDRMFSSAGTCTVYKKWRVTNTM